MVNKMNRERAVLIGWYSTRTAESQAWLLKEQMMNLKAVHDGVF